MRRNELANWVKSDRRNIYRLFMKTDQSPEFCNINAIFVTHSEISIKRGNRKRFQNQMQSNIVTRLKHEGLDWNVHCDQNATIVTVPDDTAGDWINHAVSCLCETHGVKWVSPALKRSRREFRQADQTPDYKKIRDLVVETAGRCYRYHASYAVKVDRGDKIYTRPSEELEKWLGSEISEHTSWEHVDLNSPDQLFRVRIYRNNLFVIAASYPGPGGLPVHSSGRVLSMLSGGIDSPVAAWLVARRGCTVDFIHFSASHFTPDQLAGSKMDRLAALLSRSTLQSRLFVLPYTYFDLALPSHNKPQALIVFRRFMLRCARELARSIGAQALASGDSLSQVASQTLENMVTAHNAISIPVFQPLIGYNKEEIVARARTIGTYNISTEPDKDCCSLIARNPEIKAKTHIIEKFEKHWIPEYHNLVKQTLEDLIEIRYECGKRTGITTPGFYSGEQVF